MTPHKDGETNILEMFYNKKTQTRTIYCKKCIQHSQEDLSQTTKENRITCFPYSIFGLLLLFVA
jgi:hypothetical protein